MRYFGSHYMANISSAISTLDDTTHYACQHSVKSNVAQRLYAYEFRKAYAWPFGTAVNLIRPQRLPHWSLLHVHGADPRPGPTTYGSDGT
jgi:hypothetical protein